LCVTTRYGASVVSLSQEVPNLPWTGRFVAPQIGCPVTAFLLPILFYSQPTPCLL